MEEVWKDINLASLHDHPSGDQDFSVTPRLHNPYHNNFILQDFFARPFSKDPPTRLVSAHGDSALCGSSMPPPATVLSLNSGPGFDFLDNSDPLRPTSHLPSHPVSNISSFNSHFEALDSSLGMPCFGMTLFTGISYFLQAYTNELELAVQHLKEENARLKRQQGELYLAATALLPKSTHSIERQRLHFE
ncbi:hypothetical protein GH714_016176 [Hevea brasiliensis]|uniref:Uncharacterized protein n=1 Tax=Hevea brasiliensis TaxID=3981 RepID=A0A6A6M1N3_HEVBR|nr:hypothetical protein GH714_016176 [Hevea brasiliensis]